MTINNSELQHVLLSVIRGFKKSISGVIKENNVPLSPVHYLILRSIYHLDKCTAITLAEKADKDKGQITRLVKDLITQNYVTKTPNPTDKRSQYLSLTPSGKQCFELLHNKHDEILDVMAEGLDAQELEQFINIGQKMLENLKRKNKI